MKLLLCTVCQDVVRMIKEEVRSCKCGKCSGQYTDDINAWYKGESAVPLGFDNFSLVKALFNQPEEGMGERFTAFVIPKQCPTFENRTDENI